MLAVPGSLLESFSNRLRDLCKSGCGAFDWLVGIVQPPALIFFQHPGSEHGSLMRYLSQDGILNTIRTRAKGDFHWTKCLGLGHPALAAGCVGCPKGKQESESLCRGGADTALASSTH